MGNYWRRLKKLVRPTKSETDHRRVVLDVRRAVEVRIKKSSTRILSHNTFVQQSSQKCFLANPWVGTRKAFNPIIKRLLGNTKLVSLWHSFDAIFNAALSIGHRSEKRFRYRMMIGGPWKFENLRMHVLSNFKWQSTMRLTRERERERVCVT